MKKITFKTVCVTLLVTVSSVGITTAQINTFEKNYGGSRGDYGRAMATTVDGGFIITGQTFNSDSLGDTYLMKTDKNGVKQWEKIIGGNALEGGNSIIQTTDGGYLITNHTESYGAGDCDSWLIKTDNTGNILWNVTYGGIGDDVGEQGIETSDGNYIVAGIERSLDTLGNAFLTKYDNAGNLIWVKTYGGPGVEAGVRIVETVDGGFFIAGETTTNSLGLRDILVFRTNSAGDLMWLKNIGGAGDEEAFGLCATNDGGYVIAGVSTSFGSGDDDVYLIKMDDIGNKLWSKNIGGLNNDVANSIVAAADGGFMITGFTKSFGDSMDAFIIKTDKFGNQHWMKTFGDKNHLNECKWIVVCADGGYAITGSTTVKDFPDNADVYLVKTDNEGNVASGVIEVPAPISGFVIYPNPVLNTINLSYNNSMSNPSIKIHNSLGKLIYEGENLKNIVITGLPSGIYYLTLMDGTNSYSQKFIH
ncbi:MAG: T9SS type A sorting domain-containing protein [Bacteroidia bacterium]